MFHVSSWIADILGYVLPLYNFFLKNKITIKQKIAAAALLRSPPFPPFFPLPKWLFCEFSLFISMASRYESIGEKNEAKDKNIQRNEFTFRVFIALVEWNQWKFDFEATDGRNVMAAGTVVLQSEPNWRCKFRVEFLTGTLSNEIPLRSTLTFVCNVRSNH